MSFLQSPHTRALLRRAGVKPLAYKIYSAVNRSSGYEAKFSGTLLKAIRPNDCVWDVGANVGFYTQKFAEVVGTSGTVVAIDPLGRHFTNFPWRSAATRR